LKAELKKYDTILDDAFTNAKSEQFSKKKLWLDSPWKSKYHLKVFLINV
jgi:hypothetical protein